MTRDVPAKEIFEAKLDAVEFVLTVDRWRFHRRALPNGRVLHLLPLLTGNQLGISSGDSGCFDDVWHYPRWQDEHCFIDASWRAVLGWDGKDEPEGWYRHPRTGRRRPGGDPEKEFVRL